ncbi:MAG: hypothetical protein AB7I04_09920 [Pseudomonadales bacterium]
MLVWNLRRTRGSAGALLCVLAVSVPQLPSAAVVTEDVAALEARVAELEAALTIARSELEVAKRASAHADRERIRIGPFTIGGAVRVNYVRGSYPGEGPGPNRGGDGGNVSLDTLRFNADLAHGPLIGALEYRWYDGYNFLHTGWLGYGFEDGSRLQLGVTRVPFGPGPYGISKSWFYDQHYYVGLADDMDLGATYETAAGRWDLAFGAFAGSGGSWSGASKASARYSYDVVRWRESVLADGTVLYDTNVNGYDEAGQLNARAVRHFGNGRQATDLGVSLQYGWLDGKGNPDGTHWAASIHMLSTLGGFELGTQISRYDYRISSDNPLGTDGVLPMGAYDFAWPVASRAWLPAVSLSYRLDTPGIPWLDYVLPYVEYSGILKDDSAFHDSHLLTLGAAWSRAGWYVYTDLAWSTGNLFVGNDGDDYSNLYEGVGDFGVTGNDRWNWRFNVNFGYYF